MCNDYIFSIDQELREEMAKQDAEFEISMEKMKKEQEKRLNRVIDDLIESGGLNER